MAKYEEILINEYKKLDLQKKDLVNKINHSVFRLFRLKNIDTSIKEMNWIFIRWICLNKKIRQLIDIENKARAKFRGLTEELWVIEKRIIEIRGTLFKYYDKQIKECINDLGIENVQSLEDLLIINNEKFKKQFDKEI